VASAGHMQVCTSLQTDKHASTPSLSFLQAGCPSCRPTNSVKALNGTEITTKLVLYNDCKTAAAAAVLTINQRSQSRSNKDQCWCCRQQTCCADESVIDSMLMIQLTTVLWKSSPIHSVAWSVAVNSFPHARCLPPPTTYQDRG